MERQYHDIDDSIKIDFAVPPELQELIDQAEEADKNGEEGLYLYLANDIDVMAKNCYADGLLTEHQWDLLVVRYKQW